MQAAHLKPLDRKELSSSRSKSNGGGGKIWNPRAAAAAAATPTFIPSKVKFQDFSKTNHTQAGGCQETSGLTSPT